MIKTLKVRLYQDKEQIILLEKHPGSCRFVYNHFYEVRIKYQAEHRKYGKNRLTGFDTMWMLILSANLICCKSVETVKFSPRFVNINGHYSQICVILYILYNNWTNALKGNKTTLPARVSPGISIPL